MSDGPVMAEFADRIQRLNDLADAERELQRARSAFESAQWEVVRAAEQFQEWTYEWRNRRARVLSALPDDTPVDVKLEEANATILRFCEKVEQDRLAISALSPKSSEGRLDQEQQLPDQSSPQASETDAAEEDPTAVAIAAYIEAENADTPTDAERTSVVTDHDRVDQTNTDTVAAVEIPDDLRQQELASEGWVVAEEFQFPSDDAIVEVRWSDGFCETLTFAGFTPVTHEPEWTSGRSDNVLRSVTHYRSFAKPTEQLPDFLTRRDEPETPEAGEVEGPCDSCGAAYGDLHNIETCKHLANATAEAIFDGDHTKLEAMLDRTSSNPASELDSQPQTKSEQSEIFHPDAPTWAAGFEEDRKPKPGFIEGAVSKLFGVKEDA